MRDIISKPYATYVKFDILTISSNDPDIRCRSSHSMDPGYDSERARERLLSAINAHQTNDKEEDEDLSTVKVCEHKIWRSTYSNLHSGR